MPTVGIDASHTASPLIPFLLDPGSALSHVQLLTQRLAHAGYVRTPMNAIANLLPRRAGNPRLTMWEVRPEPEETNPGDEPASQSQGSAAEMGARLETLVQELSHTATQLEAVLEATENGIIIVGTDFVVRFFNQRMAQWVDIDPRDVIGQSLSHLAELLKARAQEPEATERHILSAYEHPTGTSRFEVTIISPLFRTLRAFSTPVYTKERQALGHLLVFSDVTEQLRLQALRDEF